MGLKDMLQTEIKQIYVIHTAEKAVGRTQRYAADLLGIQH